METVLQVPVELHARLKDACQAQGVTLKAGTRALLTLALNALDAGEYNFQPVTMAPVAPSKKPSETATA